MSVRSIAGVLALHLFLLGIGTSLVWAGRGFRTAAEAVRLGGLSLLTGLAAYGLASVVVLVAGIPYRLPTMLAIGGVITAGSLLVGRRAGRGRPALRGPSGAPPLTLAVAPLVALLAVLAAAVFRAGRLEPLVAYDAWAFWVPKAQALHAFGELDEGFFTSLPGPSYPPLVPAIEATAFRFMGDVDVVTLHLVFWGVAVAFVWAVAGVLAPRVRPLLLWPTVLLLVATPDLVDRALQPQADLTLDWLFGGAVLLTALWVVERRPALLVGAALLLAAGTVTKREGLLLAACLVAAAGLATWRRRGEAWPPLLLAAGAVALAGLPWRAWFTLRDIPGDGPEAGGSGLLDELDRAWPSLRLAVETAFEPRLWLLVLPLAIVAIVLSAVARSRALAVFSGGLLALLTLGSAWVMWSFPSLPLTQDPATSPIVRLTGAAIVASGVLLPLLLERGWGIRFVPEVHAAHDRRAVALVLVAALAYPVAAAAGGVTFPSRDDCARVATSDADGELELVFGRLDSPIEAAALRDRVVAVGFVGTEVEPDGCGRWKVTNDGIDSFAQGQGTIEEARRAGFDPRLEVDPDS